MNNYNIFKIGNVIKVVYVVLLKKKKKFYSMVGLCFNKNRFSFKIINIIKREKIIMRFDINAPLVVKIFLLSLYKRYIFRLSRIYFKNNKKFKDDLSNKKNFINSSMYSYKRDFFWGAYLKKKKKLMRKKRFKKIKRKYFNTENWKTFKFMYIRQSRININYFKEDLEKEV